MRRPRTVLLALLVAGVLLVPSAAAAGERTVVESLERRDIFHVADVACEVISRQVHYSDGTVGMSTLSHAVDATNAEACFWGAIEVRVRYSYRDADGDLQSGEAVAPRFVLVEVPYGSGTELQSLHRATYFDGTSTPDYPLPK